MGAPWRWHRHFGSARARRHRKTCDRRNAIGFGVMNRVSRGDLPLEAVPQGPLCPAPQRETGKGRSSYGKSVQNSNVGCQFNKAGVSRPLTPWRRWTPALPAFSGMFIATSERVPNRRGAGFLFRRSVQTDLEDCPEMKKFLQSRRLANIRACPLSFGIRHAVLFAAELEQRLSAALVFPMHFALILVCFAG